MSLNPRQELIEMLNLLKEQASVMPDCIADENNYPVGKTTVLEDISLDSFLFVISTAVEYIKEW